GGVVAVGEDGIEDLRAGTAEGDLDAVDAPGGKAAGQPLPAGAEVAAGATVEIPAIDPLVAQSDVDGDGGARGTGRIAEVDGDVACVPAARGGGSVQRLDERLGERAAQLADEEPG